jgi:tetratricopeptide (TPR) repeat protein
LHGPKAFFSRHHHYLTFAGFSLPAAMPGPSTWCSRLPSRPLLALPAAGRIELIDLTPPDFYELAFREGMARFDVTWHVEQAEQAERASQWFAAVFHWGQLARHDPGYALFWAKLQAASARVGDGRRALAICDRVLRQDPGLAPVYFRRARLRALVWQFEEASADQLAGLALVARNPIGWPWSASGAVADGNASAQNADWGAALRHFTDAVLWERQQAWHRQRLAWAQLAAGQEAAFRATCRALYDSHRTTKDVQGTYRLAAELGLGLAPGPSYVRGLGGPAADALLQAMQRSRNSAIVYTACLVPDHGLPAAELVRLAQENVQQVRGVDYLEDLGAAQYRAGKYADACKTLEEAVKLRGDVATVWAKLFLAMSYHRQGQAELARKTFHAATLTRDASWEERLIFNRLSAEAAALLKIDPKAKR